MCDLNINRNGKSVKIKNISKINDIFDDNKQSRDTRSDSLNSLGITHSLQLSIDNNDSAEILPQVGKNGYLKLQNDISDTYPNSTRQKFSFFFVSERCLACTALISKS